VLRLGLRAQIVIALSIVFALSFALLGTATVQLTTAAGGADRVRSARLWAEAIATLIDAEQGGGQGWERTLDRVLAGPGARGAIAAVRVERPGGGVFTRGHPHGAPVTMPLAGGRTLTLWLEPVAQPDAALGNLLLFYVTMTGLAVLILTTIALTYLIVRPLDRLTRSSELLATGAQHVRVPETGAAEVARLAGAFNAMAAQLRAERLALETRLRDLERATEELRAAERQVIHGEKLASVGRLAAGVAHEIGNPLAAILGLLELLKEGDLDATRRAEFLGRVQRETERIHYIIRDLLAFARQEPVHDTPGQTADLREVVHDAVNLVRPQKESRDVTIEVRIPDGLGRVAGPQPRLTQVVLNLLLNALDAIEGKGRIVIEASRVVDADEVVLVVSDDGPGFPPELRDQLFEPFTTTKPAGKGTGLGLAVCHALVTAMGGTIRALDTTEGGARIEVHLLRGGSRSLAPPPPSA
jgi:signal transduction histidine kinase